MAKSSIATRIFVGFSVIIFISAISGLVSWRGLVNIRHLMNEYTRWGDIDMVMNERVIQKSILLDNRLNQYLRNPIEENLSNLKDAEKDLGKGVESWGKMVGGDAELKITSEKLKTSVNELDENINLMSRSFGKMDAVRKKWDSIIDNCISFLEETMEKDIDPEKKRAEDKADIRAMVRWGEIDMVMKLLSPTS